ncbi:uncharacterized protein LOC134270785 [Saccostrea cucullata]|uniref:uncharacterized protein LOC134270785 n=1 Tax=Saccostrea cuccullata TaxID=36930 RepID=UPI002ED5F4C9
MDDRRKSEVSGYRSRKYCCICSNYRGKSVGGKVISLHRFPSDTNKKKIWLQRARLIRKDFNYSKNSYICSVHFVNNQGPSADHPLPSIFPNKTFKTSAPTTCTSTSSFPITQPEDVNPEIESMDYQDSLEQSDDPLRDSLNMHDYHKDWTCTGEVPNNKETQTTIFSKDASTQTDGSHLNIAAMTNSTSAETQTDEKRGIDKGTQVCRPVFTFEDIEHDNSKILFYTGIPNKETFNAVFDEIKDDAYKNTRRASSSSSNKGRPRRLRIIDEFFLVLLRLRLGLLLEDLANRFNVSVSTCSKIFNLWIDFLFVQLQPLIMWPSRDTINATMPISFKRKFSNCRVIVDCTEVFVQTPSSLANKSLMYSDYKSHMTFKGLIGISPAGVTTFVSDLWGGSISDKQLTKKCGILHLCEVGDAIMADKGFVISDLTTPKGIHLIIPPFKKKNHQMSRNDVLLTRDIARLRIHVERQMERIKNFHIFEGVMHISMASQCSKIWKICVALTNLLPPLCNVPDYDIVS